MLNARIQRVTDKFTRAPGGRFQRIALRRCNQLKTTGRRHFDKGALLVAGYPVKPFHAMAQGAGHRNMHNASLRCRDHRFDGAFTAVRDRQFDVNRLRKDLAKPLLYRCRNLKRTQTFLIRVRCDNNFHKPSLRIVVTLSIHHVKNRPWERSQCVYRTMHGRLLSNVHSGIRYCIAIASSRAPSPCF